MANKNEAALLQKDITDSVNSRIAGLRNEGLTLPQNYNYSNALKSAWFTILKTKDKTGRSALEVATRDSIANALLDMVVQGLSPAKTQVYFIVYGKELQLQRSYFGTQAVLKRLTSVKDIWAEVVHEDDEFEIGSYRGRTIVKKFDPKFENQDKGIIAAYAVIEKNDGELVYTVMTKKEIDKAWSKRKNSGSVQNEFPQEMAKRTVINRAAKSFINTSDDSDLLTEAINRTTADEYDNNRERKDITPESEKVKALEQKLQQNNLLLKQENEETPPKIEIDIATPVNEIRESEPIDNIDLFDTDLMQTIEKSTQEEGITLESEEEDYPF